LEEHRVRGPVHRADHLAVGGQGGPGADVLAAHPGVRRPGAAVRQAAVVDHRQGNRAQHGVVPVPRRHPAVRQLDAHRGQLRLPRPRTNQRGLARLDDEPRAELRRARLPPVVVVHPTGCRADPDGRRAADRQRRPRRGLQPEAEGIMSVNVENLSVAYRSRKGDVTAVDDVSFSLADGEIMGLAGESGSGKSTLGNALVYLDPRMKTTGGKVTVDGKNLPIADNGAMRHRRMTDVSLVPQYAMSALTPTRKIGRLINDLLKSHQVKDREEVYTELKRRLALIGLKEDVLNKYSFELSGGMRQRVTIIMS